MEFGFLFGVVENNDRYGVQLSGSLMSTFLTVKVHFICDRHKLRRIAH